MKGHDWIGAATLILNDSLARQANKNGKLTIISRITVDVLDVYCKHCRRSFDAARDMDCVIGPQHIGGPRKQPDPIQLTISDDWPEPHDPLAL